MPGDYAVINDGRLVVEYWSEPLAIRDILEHEALHLADDTIKENALCIVDMRNIVSNLTIEEIHRIAQMNLTSPNGLKHYKIAIVCTESDIYRQSQIYELSLCEQGVSIITFTSLPVACAWLDIDLHDVEFTVSQLKNRIENLQVRVVDLDRVSPSRNNQS
jgi:hypothetical protein